MIRPDVVQRLIDAACRGLVEEAKGTSVGEVATALVTLTINMARQSVDPTLVPEAAMREENRAIIRGNVLRLLMETADQEQKQ